MNLMKFDVKAFWENVKFLCDSKGMSLKELSDNCMVSYGTIRNEINRDACPSVEIAFRIAQVLGTNTDFLITGKSQGIDSVELTELRKAAQELKDLKAKLKELAQ